MPDHLVPSTRVATVDDGALQRWQEPRPEVAMGPTPPSERIVAALRRYKWAMVAVVLLAIGGGIVATRLVTPQYEVRASIMITSDSPMESRSGPIRSTGLLSADDWNNLLKSFAVTDAVVRKLSLYLQPDNYSLDHPLFAGFALADRFVPGRYELVIDQTNKRWTLLANPSGIVADQGAAADSVGRKRGFLWVPPAWLYSVKGTRKVRFTVFPPREVSARLVDRLGAQRREESNFLRLTLQDPDPQLAAKVLNAWVDEFVSVAAQFKRRKLTDFATTLQAQLQTAKAALDNAEMQLSSFRVNTITQPSEGGPIAAGVQETRDPVIKAYFDRKIAYDDILHDVHILETLLANAKDSIPNEALLQIRSVSATGALEGQELRNAIAEYHTAESSLAQARRSYTDEHPIVRNLVTQVNTLRRETIPHSTRSLLASLRSRASADSVRIAGASTNLQRIPQRTIEEERLRRIRDISSALYTNLQNRYSEAQLAEASATPDVAVMDSAIAPLTPTANTASRVLLMAVVGGIGAAFGLALLLDKLDTRIRYPSQVEEELGLPIAGTVPKFHKAGITSLSVEQAYQLTESFRSLRMGVMHSVSNGAVSLAISSPSPGEGKSLIAANLAMSFAEAGYRTILVDADTRRGALNVIFDLPAGPGLTELLAGSATLDAVIRDTSQASLRMITCGARMRRSPELLTSERLPKLVADLRSMFDVTVFDTSPLAAGIDGYSVAAATGSLLVVLRVGQSKRRMAAAKLRIVERLPVDVLGVVLNGILMDGEYAYYSYVTGYDAHDAEPATAVTKSP